MATRAQLQQELDSLLSQRELLEAFRSAATTYDVRLSLLLAIASRESAMGQLIGEDGYALDGSNREDVGIMQINLKAHPEYAARFRTGYDVYENIHYGARVLRSLMRHPGLVRRARPGIRSVLPLAVSAYNTGPGAVMRAIDRGYEPDRYTTGGDYGRDVMERAVLLRELLADALRHEEEPYRAEDLNFQPERELGGPLAAASVEEEELPAEDALATLMAALGVLEQEEQALLSDREPPAEGEIDIGDMRFGAMLFDGARFRSVEDSELTQPTEFTGQVQTSVQIIPLLRTDTQATVNEAADVSDVQLVLTVNATYRDDVNRVLRPLVAMVRRIPFIPVRGRDIARALLGATGDMALAIRNSLPELYRFYEQTGTAHLLSTLRPEALWLPVTVRALQIETQPGLPGVFRVVMTLRLANLQPYVPQLTLWCRTRDALRWAQHLALRQDNTSMVLEVSDNYATLVDGRGNRHTLVTDELLRGQVESPYESYVFAKFYRGLLEEYQPAYYRTLLEMGEAPPLTGAVYEPAYPIGDHGRLMLRYREGAPLALRFALLSDPRRLRTERVMADMRRVEAEAVQLARVLQLWEGQESHDPSVWTTVVSYMTLARTVRALSLSLEAHAEEMNRITETAVAEVTGQAGLVVRDWRIEVEEDGEVHLRTDGREINLGRETLAATAAVRWRDDQLRTVSDPILGDVQVSVGAELRRVETTLLSRYFERLARLEEVALDVGAEELVTYMRLVRQAISTDDQATLRLLNLPGLLEDVLSPRLLAELSRRVPQKAPAALREALAALAAELRTYLQIAGGVLSVLRSRMESRVSSMVQSEGHLRHMLLELDRATLERVSITEAPRFADQKWDGYEHPVPQHMGYSGAYVMLELVTDDAVLLDQIGLLLDAQRQLGALSREQTVAPALIEVVGEGNLLSALGIRRLALEKLTMTKAEDRPGWTRVVLGFVQDEAVLSRHERLRRFGSAGQDAVAISVASPLLVPVDGEGEDPVYRTARRLTMQRFVRAMLGEDATLEDVKRWRVRMVEARYSAPSSDRRRIFDLRVLVERDGQVRALRPDLDFMLRGLAHFLDASYRRLDALDRDLLVSQFERYLSTTSDGVGYIGALYELVRGLVLADVELSISYDGRPRPDFVASQGVLLTGTVTRIVSGDTLLVRTDEGVEVPVRLWGIDVPRREQPYGADVEAALVREVLGRRVVLHPVETDVQGRMVAAVRVEGMDEPLSNYMVRMGLAWPVLGDPAQLEELARQAQGQRAGLWRVYDRQSLVAWRRQQQPDRYATLDLTALVYRVLRLLPQDDSASVEVRRAASPLLSLADQVGRRLALDWHELLLEWTGMLSTPARSASVLEATTWDHLEEAIARLRSTELEDAEALSLHPDFLLPELIDPTSGLWIMAPDFPYGPGASVLLDDLVQEDYFNAEDAYEHVVTTVLAAASGVLTAAFRSTGETEALQLLERARSRADAEALDALIDRIDATELGRSYRRVLEERPHLSGLAGDQLSEELRALAPYGFLTGFRRPGSGAISPHILVRMMRLSALLELSAVRMLVAEGTVSSGSLLAGGAPPREHTVRAGLESYLRELEDKVDRLFASDPAYVMAEYGYYDPRELPLRRKLRDQLRRRWRQPIGLRRAFPAIQVAVLGPVGNQNLRLLADAYSYSAVLRVEIAAETSAAGQYATVSLSNLRARLVDDSDVLFLGSRPPDDHRLRLEAGAHMAVYIGYGSDRRHLHPFVGRVTRVRPGPVTEIELASYSTSLLNPVNEGGGFYVTGEEGQTTLGDFVFYALTTTPGLEGLGRGMLAGLRDVLGRTARGLEFDEYQAWLFMRSLDAVGLDSLLGHRWKDLDRLRKLEEQLGTGSVYRLMLSGPELWENIWLAASPQRDVNLGRWLTGDFAYKVITGEGWGWVAEPGQTCWSVLQDVSKLLPGWIVTARPYNASVPASEYGRHPLRQTLYMGPRGGYYRATDRPRVLKHRAVTAVRERLMDLIREYYRDEALDDRNMLWHAYRRIIGPLLVVNGVRLLEMDNPNAARRFLNWVSQQFEFIAHLLQQIGSALDMRRPSPSGRSVTAGFMERLARAVESTAPMIGAVLREIGAVDNLSVVWHRLGLDAETYEEAVQRWEQQPEARRIHPDRLLEAFREDLIYMVTHYEIAANMGLLSASGLESASGLLGFLREELEEEGFVSDEYLPIVEHHFASVYTTLISNQMEASDRDPDFANQVTLLFPRDPDERLVADRDPKQLYREVYSALPGLHPDFIVNHSVYFPNLRYDWTLAYDTYLTPLAGNESFNSLSDRLERYQTTAALYQQLLQLLVALEPSYPDEVATIRQLLGRVPAVEALEEIQLVLSALKREQPAALLADRIAETLKVAQQLGDVLRKIADGEQGRDAHVQDLMRRYLELLRELEHTPVLRPIRDTVGINLLRERLRRMYGGVITLQGNPSIHPYHVLHLWDDVRGIFGPVEVDAVRHVLDGVQGYVTEVRPALLLYDRGTEDLVSVYSLSELYFLLQIAWLFAKVAVFRPIISLVGPALTKTIDGLNRLLPLLLEEQLINRMKSSIPLSLRHFIARTLPGWLSNPWVQRVLLVLFALHSYGVTQRRLELVRMERRARVYPLTAVPVVRNGRPFLVGLEGQLALSSLESLAPSALIDAVRSGDYERIVEVLKHL